MVDSIHGGGRPVSREDLPLELVPVFVNWTIKDKMAAILSSLD